VDGEGYARMTYCVTQEVAEEVARRAARMRP
jgi:hypothetical protein